MTTPSPEERLRAAGTGQRAVVRYRIDGGLTDALGTITALDDAGCTLATRTGEVRIPWDLVTAGKAVPPAPERRGPRLPEPPG
ncbi:hypothetical protein ACFVRT_01440 [Arthrobacter koreensis]|uniref:Ferrous iron transport protein A n=1 Tax=Arthrobacter koreensis TaxID=199136 RepID=A0ABY6FQG7_9MICC|nr:hypothetical protein [Arthrobacter koreensis]UYB35287.1 hypothetical protein N9A08_11675 [Arthrobacter koreensis]